VFWCRQPPLQLIRRQSGKWRRRSQRWPRFGSLELQIAFWLIIGCDSDRMLCAVDLRIAYLNLRNWLKSLTPAVQWIFGVLKGNLQITNISIEQLITWKNIVIVVFNSFAIGKCSYYGAC
jgi:lipid-A-disaccharide synthase-like uncharacterized protein